MSLITPPAMLSYPNLFVPRMPMTPRPGQKAQYSCVLVFRKDADLKELKTHCLQLLIEKFGGQAEVEKLLASRALRWPFRTDLDGKYDEAVYGSWIRAWTENKPGLVSKWAGADGKAMEITDPNEFYPGCIVRASVNPFVYNASGNKGVSFGLQNMQKLEDAPRIDNRRNAKDEFDAQEAPTAEIPTAGAAATAAPAAADTSFMAGGKMGSKLADLLGS